MIDDKKPLISVIIPMYNAEKYIEKCINSVIKQTYKNLEILCIDDHSSDNTKKIVQKIAQKDNRIIIKNSEGKYIGGTRNTGLKYANGKYIIFLDNDDCIDKNTCQIALNIYNKYDPDLVVYYAKQIFPDSPKHNPNNIFKITLIGKQNIDDSKRLATINTPWNKMYKKSIIDKYNIRFPEDCNLEDVCFWWKYNQVIKTVYYIDKYLYLYRMHSNNTVKSQIYKASLSQDSIKIMEDVYEFLEKNNLTQINIQSYILFICSVVQELYNNTLKNDLNYLKRVSNFIKNNKILSTKLNISFIKNMINEDYYKIPELKLYKPLDYIFSFKEGLERFYLTFLGIKLKIKKHL